MKVLHVASGNMYGGIESMLATVARARHVCAEMDPHFAVCFDGRLAEDLRASGAPVHRLGDVRVRNPIGARRARRALGDLMARERIDVVVCHGAWTQALFGPSVRRSGRPLVVWQHAPPRQGYWLDRWAARTKPDLFICNSEFTAAAVSAAMTGVAVEVVYCPVSPAPTVDRAEVRRRVRASMGVGDDVLVIVQVSRLEPSKGHVDHLEALRDLQVPGPWQCWFVGGVQRPSEHAYLMQLVDAVEKFGLADRVRFLGQRADVDDVLAAADVFCQPNADPEPFGIVFVEALYAGLPIVATRLGGPAEIVDDTCGLLVAAGRADEISRALAGILADSARRRLLAANGPARARELCDPAARLGQLHRAVSRTLPASKEATVVS